MLSGGNLENSFWEYARIVFTSLTGLSLFLANHGKSIRTLLIF